jgi:hypothetical protein
MFLRHNLPILLCVCRFHKLAIVTENHVFVRVPHFERERLRVFEVSEVVGGKTVTQCVVRPFVDVSGNARLIEQPPEVLARCDVALMFTQRQQLFAQIRLQRHMPSPRSLCVLRGDFD